MTERVATPVALAQGKLRQESQGYYPSSLSYMSLCLKEIYYVYEWKCSLLLLFLSLYTITYIININNTTLFQGTIM